jgi:uncharacterized protein YjiK
VTLDRLAGTVYGIDAVTGVLYALSPADVGVRIVGPTPLLDVTGLAWLEDRGVLAATAPSAGADGTDLHLVDPLSGAAVRVASLGAGPRVDALAARLGLLVGVDRARDVLVSIDVATGAVVEVGPLGAAGEDVVGLTFDATAGRLYGMDAASERLVEIDPVSGHAVPWAAPARPSTQGIAHVHGGWFFASDPLAGELYAFQKQEPADPTLEYVTALAFDASAGVLYAADAKARQILTLDAAGEVLHRADLAIDVPIDGLAFDAPAGVLFAVAGDVLLRVDPVTGAKEDVGTMGAGPLLGLAVDASDGSLLALQRVSNVLARIDRAGGAAQLVAHVLGAEAAEVVGLAYDDAAGRLLAVGRTGLLLEIDPVTGEAAAFAHAPVPLVAALAYDAANGVLFVLDDDAGVLVRLDRATGQPLP